MKRKLAIAVLVLLVLLALAALVLWYFMSKPLYEPGMVRSGDRLRAALAPPEQSGDPNFWTVEKDIKLHHFSEGAGKHVLMVHGGPGYPSHEPWPGLKPLTGNYRFIYYDQRGCGKSTRPFDKFFSSSYYENMTTLERTLGLGAQVADIERIRRIIGEDKLTIVGHSFGGFLASLYAAEFPERVRALILVAPADVLVMPIEGGGLFEEVKRRLPENMRQEFAGLLSRYMDYRNIFSKSESELATLNAEFARYYMAAVGNQGQAMPNLSDAKDTGGWMVHAMYFSMGRRHNYRDALKNVKCPALVIHGDKDLQPERASRAYADGLPNSRFQVIEDCGHFPFREQPERFAEVTGKFLSEVM